MRTFIAITLPQGIKEALSQVQNQLKKSGAEVRWVKPENIHLTLKFLGEIDEETLQSVCAALEGISCRHRFYTAEISSLGSFPRNASARVLWVGIEQGKEETETLSQAIEDELSTKKIPREEREFQSHITLGRLTSNLNRFRLIEQLLLAASRLKENKLCFPVRSLTLYKSTLSPAGPGYEIIQEFSLQTN
ncbi:MAG: RNA 2',3'-cyclic phosphodiesterase [Candidatus Omnitrophica bacterium]|nr:RNA 2',3'-cyclic phosphodiesterase [Candidatus Omnitrophota bacterium]